jgi:hypothetical protein
MFAHEVARRQKVADGSIIKNKAFQNLKSEVPESANSLADFQIVPGTPPKNALA